ncbi:MAG: transposase family protein, partial [Thermoplasmata archaeon]|nr:transposase family protein [Thermoplasmata archaeon]
WELSKPYRKACKKEKGRLLDEMVRLTDYNRCYASWVLRNCRRVVILKGKGKARVVFVGDHRKSIRRRKRKTYGSEVFSALKSTWEVCGYICGKRLAPYLKEIVPVLEKHGELALDKETRSGLLRMSAATVDRLLAAEKKKLRLKGRCRTKPGSLLKSQIPIRTFAEWDEKKPGFLEVDLVGHDGGSTQGDYIQTLDATDVHSGWTETKAVKNKAQIWTLDAMKEIVGRVPFRVLGIDSDNGGEFINAHLKAFCEEKKITFTRSRPFRKNDNCFVEQKNYSVVRRAVGYWRYDTEEEREILNELYEYLRLYTNFFQPVMKLREKQRIGSKVIKRYDEAKTPYQRVLECVARDGVSSQMKRRLRREYARTNPAELNRKIGELQNQLIDVARGKRPRPGTASRPKE